METCAPLSAKIRNWPTPLPPFKKKLKFAYLPFPSCQKKMEEEDEEEKAEEEEEKEEARRPP